MDIVFHKFVGALRERRLDMAMLAFFHLLWRLPGGMASIVFSKANDKAIGSAVILAHVFFAIRMVVYDLITSGDALVGFYLTEIVRWSLIIYPICLLSITLYRFLQRQIRSTYGRIEQYQPRKRKENTVYTNQSLSRLLEDNPSRDFELGDDGELIPVTVKKH